MRNLNQAYILKIVLIAATALSFILKPLPAEEKPVARTILLLWDNTDEFQNYEDDTYLHRYAEMPLNYLGFTVRYCNIANGLPKPSDTENIHGILTWFRDQVMTDPDAYCQWAIKQMAAGRKYISLDHLGFLENSKTNKPVNQKLLSQFLNAMGVEFRANWTNNPLLIELVYKDSAMVEFERTLDNEFNYYEHIVSVNPQNHVYLKIKRTDVPNSVSDAVIVTPAGGLVSEGYAIWINPVTLEGKWRIDPFRFFEDAFHINELPRYDTTTLFGRRILYSHIDGDGVRNVSRVEPNRISGEIIRDHILKKYNIPITASFVTAEIDPKYYGSEKLVALAKSIYALPNVEIGVHAFSHPLSWENRVTVFEIPNYSKILTKEEVERMDLPSESTYGSGARILVGEDEFLKREIDDAINFVNTTLAPKNKQTAIYQWTGNCRPVAKAIQRVQRLGLANINGGDTRFDSLLTSYTSVAPLTRQPSGQCQILSSNANENIYTAGWKAPFDRYRRVIETFQQTENPTLISRPARRISPINVYYHFFIGEQKKSLETLHDVYKYALNQHVIPVFTSAYAKNVLDFTRATITQLDDGAYRFLNYGNCRTIRFDKREGEPDLEHSTGILGFSRWNQSTYVHLTETNDATLRWTRQNTSQPYLEDSSTVVSKMTILKENISFETQAIAVSVLRWQNMAPNTTYIFTIRNKDNHDSLTTLNVKSNSVGALELKFEMNGHLDVKGSALNK